MRDASGIPHIFAQTDEGAMFGLGYVSAENRLLQMEYSRRIVQGRLAEMLGDVGPRGSSVLDSDLKFRRMGIFAHARELAGRLDGRTQRLLRAYAAGVNLYMVLNRARLPSTFILRGTAPEPWAPEDCLAVWERIADFFGPGWADKAKPLHEFEDLVAKGLTEKEAAAHLAATRILFVRHLYDGREEIIETRNEVVEVRGGSPRAISVRWSRIGPVVTDLVADRRAGEEYALKTPFLADDHGHTVEALLAMMTASDASTFGDAIAAWASPGVNVVFGDSRGNIGYWTKAAIPLRSPLSPLGSQAAQSGEGKAFDWQDIIPHQFLPHVVNPASGILFSGNHLPAGAWYPLPLGLGTGGAGDTQRSWRLRTLLASEEKIFTPEDVRAVHFDDVNQAVLTIFEAGERLLAKGIALSGESVELLNLLGDWVGRGGHCRTDEPYFAGAYHIQRQFRLAQAGPLLGIYGGGENGLCAFLKALSKKLSSNPAPGLGAAEIAYIDESLKTGWKTAVAQYGADPSKWQTTFDQSVGRLAVPYGVNLEGFPSLDPALDFISGVLSDPEGGTIWSQKGNSYTQWIDLADPDRSLALLPPGISENPASAFYRLEQNPWERGELRPAPLSRSAVEKTATRSFRLVYR